jgi:hypothetical protein
MPEEMYGESDDAAPAPPPGDKPPGPPKEKSSGKTAVVPIDIFPGGPPEPGDVCEFEAIAVHGQEVELRYVEHNEEETKGEGEAPPPEAAMGGGGPPKGGDGDMGGMY